MTPIYSPSLLITEKKRHETILKRQETYDTLWDPIYKTITTLKNPVWGYRKKLKNGLYDESEITTLCRESSPFSIEKYTVSCDTYEKYSTSWVLTRSLEELGLLMNDENLDEEAYQALKDRLAGVSPQLTYRQDLLNRYDEADDLLITQNKIIGECNETIERYISSRMYNTRSGHMRYDTFFIVYLHINGREYHWLPREHDKLFQYPESEIVHIYEADILEDEKKYPAIHGVRYVDDIPESKVNTLESK